MLSDVLKKFLRFSTAGPALERFYIMPHVKIHYIKEDDREFHSHPWNGISFIFGSYWEEMEGELEVGDDYQHRVWHKRTGINFISAFKKHKVYLKNNKPVWTLFINGPRVNEKWEYGKVAKPWEGSDQERERDKANA